MKIRYDAEADAAYLAIGRAVRPGEAVRQVTGIRAGDGEGEIILDLDADGRLIGIEVLRASALLRAKDLESAEPTANTTAEHTADRPAIAEMTQIAQAVLNTHEASVYDAMMDGAGRLLQIIDDEHAGGAYILWSEVCDAWERSDDIPVNLAKAHAIAIDWLQVDTASKRDIDGFFDRWVRR